jgi:hypothetical protein
MAPVRARQQQRASAPTAEYVLIGPSHDLDEIAKMFAELGPPPAMSRPTSPRSTVEIPTVRVRVWAQPDGSRFVEVHDHRGQSVTARVFSSLLRR